MLQGEVNVVELHSGPPLHLHWLRGHYQIGIIAQIQLLQVRVQVNGLRKSDQLIRAQVQLLQCPTTTETLWDHLQVITAGIEDLQGGQLADARWDAIKVQLVIVQVQSPESDQFAEGRRKSGEGIPGQVEGLQLCPPFHGTGEFSDLIVTQVQSLQVRNIVDTFGDLGQIVLGQIEFC